MAMFSFVFPLLVPAMFLNASPLNLTSNAAGGRAVAQAYVQAVRDAMRSGDGRGNNWNVGLDADWKVSDIAYWQAATNSDMYAFEVKNTVLNKSWLFVFPGRDQAQDALVRGDTMQPGGASIGLNYVQNVDVTPATGNYSTTVPYFLIFFNTDTVTDDYELAFTNTTNLTYGTGDFTNPGTANLPWNTAGKMANFLPSHTKNPRGALIPLTSTTDLSLTDLMVSFDDNPSAPACYFYKAAGGDRDAATVGVIGDVLTSITPGDTFLAALVWAYMTTATTSFGVAGGTGAAGFCGWVDGRTSAGTAKTNWELTGQKTLTFTNRKDGGGNFIWYRLRVVEGLNDKGHVRDDVMREIGGHNIAQDYRDRYEAPAGACMVKYNSVWAINYPDNVPNFPFEWSGRFLDTP